MARALKVYRTAIGFHDAYVAAPTQKAALAAWGTTHNLFARGEVEVVTDPALTEAPLATPGKTVKRLRGTAAEQVAALPKGAKRQQQRKSAVPEGEPPRNAKARTKPAVPRPSRAVLERAESAEIAAGGRYDREMAALAEEEAALTARRRTLEAERKAERDRLAAATAGARADYERAIRDWTG